MEIKVKAPAKINLTLEVLGKRPDGYHNISTVMQAVDLYDVITITDNDSGKVTISCNYEGVPCDDSNICAKAAYRFFDYCKMDVKGVHIDINKTIPTQAGLAGGSSDGAAVIMGLNAMFSTMLKSDEMRAIGEKVGADVPFCIEGGTKLCTGTGTTIKKLPTFRCSDIVICSTTIFNDFELALQIPEVNEIKRVMLSCKARGAGMSGSGSAVFAIFTTSGRAKKCYEQLKEKYPETFLCKPVKIGCAVD